MFWQDVRAVRGMGQGISDHHVVLCKVRLVGTWIKRGEVVDGARRIINEKLREHHYTKRYTGSFGGKRVECDGEKNVEQMWEQMRRAMVESARELCGSVRVEGGNPKNVKSYG